MIIRYLKKINIFLKKIWLIIELLVYLLIFINKEKKVSQHLKQNKMKTTTTTYQGYKQPKGQTFCSTDAHMRELEDLITI